MAQSKQLSKRNHTNTPINFDKDAKQLHGGFFFFTWRLFKQTVLEQSGTHRQTYKQKMTFNLSLNPYTKKINSKRITHLNIKCRTIKILEKKYKR